MMSKLIFLFPALCAASESDARVTVEVTPTGQVAEGSRATHEDAAVAMAATAIAKKTEQDKKEVKEHSQIEATATAG